jgi:hypothetical protein
MSFVGIVGEIVFDFDGVVVVFVVAAAAITYLMAYERE